MCVIPGNTRSSIVQWTHQSTLSLWQDVQQALGEGGNTISLAQTDLPPRQDPGTQLAVLGRRQPPLSDAYHPAAAHLWLQVAPSSCLARGDPEPQDTKATSFPKIPRWVGGTRGARGRPTHRVVVSMQVGHTSGGQGPGPGPHRPRSGGTAAQRCPPRSPAAGTCRGCRGPRGDLREDRGDASAHPGDCPQSECSLTSVLLVPEDIPTPGTYTSVPGSHRCWAPKRGSVWEAEPGGRCTTCWWGAVSD